MGIDCWSDVSDGVAWFERCMSDCSVKPTRLPITHLSIHFCFIRRRHELPQESVELGALNEAVAWKEKLKKGEDNPRA